MTDPSLNAYPGYDVLEKWDTPSFNEQTRTVLSRRMKNVPTRSFFSSQAYRTLEAVCARVLPQPHRKDDPVPIAPWIDADLAAGRRTGTRYEDMPPDGEAWRRALDAIDAEAQHQHGVPFAALGGQLKDDILTCINQGEVGHPASWEGLTPQTFFRMIMLPRIVSIYYVHPAAMSEIGFGGPASPRGYVRLEADKADPWEAPLQHRKGDG